MKLNINYYTLEPRRFIAGTVGSYGFEEMELTFSEEWKSLSKKVVFYPAGGGTPVQVLYSGAFLIPAEAYAKRGVCRFAVVGYQGNKVLITATGEMDILEALPAEATDAVPPTESEITQACSLAQSALSEMEQFKARAQAGEFNGSSPYIGDNGNWFVAGTDTGVYGVAHRINDDDAGKYTLWSSERTNRFCNTHYAGNLIGKASGTEIYISDALARENGEAGVSIFGETSVSRTPSLTQPAKLKPLTKATVTMYGRNLLDPAKLEEGTINALNGQVAPDSSRTRTGMIPLKPGTYYFGVHTPARIHLYASDGTWISAVAGSAQFSMPETASYVKLVFVNTLANLNADPPVISRSADVSPVAYNKRTVNLTLQSMYGVPGAKDELVSMPEYGFVALIRRTTTVTLTGAETGWTGNGDGCFVLTNAVPTAIRSGCGGYSTHFVYDLYHAKTGSGMENNIGIEGTTLYVAFPLEDYTTVEEFKTWLVAQNSAGTPVTVVCANQEDDGQFLTGDELFAVTPTEESMTLQSTVPIEMTYQKDPQIVISRLTERVAALESAATAA